MLDRGRQQEAGAIGAGEDRVRRSRRHQEAAEVLGPVVPDALVAALKPAPREHPGERTPRMATRAEQPAGEATVTREGRTQTPSPEETRSGARNASNCPDKSGADLTSAQH